MIVEWLWKSRMMGLLWLCFFTESQVSGQDWPMWRYDAQRSSASENRLPADLELIWQKPLSARQQAWDDPLNLDLMTYDRVFEPIVLDGKLFVGFNDQDRLLALDADTGQELWSVYADAPVRLPPAGSDAGVFFCSDDGFLYCVDPRTGKVRWKFNGAPSSQHSIGNRRLTSAWPARGGPVVREGVVYFAASIWPFMGTFLYALDAETGEIQWVNDNTGAQYIKQPHSAPSFAGVAPQGALVATDKLLVVPGGRSVPAVFDRADGSFRYFEINAGGKGTGGSFVSADDQHFYVHTREKGTRAFQLSDGVKTAFTPTEPVLHDGMVYSAEQADGKSWVRAYSADQEVVWEIEVDGSGDLILAGDQLVAAGKKQLSVIQLPKNEQAARIVQSIPVDQQVERLIVADQKLFAVAISGELLAYGNGSKRKKPGHQPVASAAQKQNAPQRDAVSGKAKHVVADLLASGDPQGYALWFGSSESDAVLALAADSPFVQLAVVDSDADAVDRSRRRLGAQGLYGSVTVHQSEPSTFLPPKYVANMVFLDRGLSDSLDPTMVRALYESVRPYGGVMHLLATENREAIAEQVTAMELEQAEVNVGPHGVVVRRVGALPGSADWTHQYGDVANSIKSDDRRVKLPLGVLWFGGSSNMDVLPRHGHGPPEQVVGGRLFIQGMNSLSARDVYTGRVLWIREFKNLGTFDVYYDDTFDDTPLDTKYNQVHIPGANGRGTNYVVTEDRVYIVEGNVCHVLDPSTGKTLTDFRMPTSDSATDDSSAQANWGYIGVYKDVLIGGLGFANYRDRHSLSFESDKSLRKNSKGFGSKSFDRAASAGLVGFDRVTGKVLWRIDAHHSFLHNGIVAGGDQIYCLDKNPALIEKAMQRRGKSQPDTYRIVALDYRTGKPNWQTTDGIFGTWLGYSEQHDRLLQAGAAASDRLAGEVSRGMVVYSAGDGTVQWENRSLKYSGPCILHNDLIITNTNSYAESAGAFYLRDGKQKLVPNPITGQLQPWKLTRAYGCNSIIASENLLTFRSGAAGYYDLQTNSGTGNLGGFKSGCTANLVVANGVLNAPDYTRTCSCAYQNQTSLALVHMPGVELWSVNSAASLMAHGKTIENIGINFGAPGDRRDADGLLWLEYPVSAGPSPPIEIELNEGAQAYRSHSSTVSESKFPWLVSSGVDAITDIKVAIKLRDEYELHTGIPVIHADDDAEESETGSVDLSSKNLEFTQKGGTQVVGLRFNKIQLQPDAIIRDAYIQFTCDAPSHQPTSLTIAAEDTGNAQRFSKTKHDLSSRTLTKTEIVWDPDAWMLKGAATPMHRTPNLAKVLRSIITRPDWKPGNSIAFLVSGNGNRIAAAYGKANEKQARLIVDVEPSPDLAIDQAQAEKYRVRLVFGIPKSTETESRVFDVYAQGERVLQDVTLKPSAGGGESVEHVLDNIPISKELHLRLEAKQGQPLLSGIELVRQRADKTD